MRRTGALSVPLLLVVAACLPPPIGRELTTEFPAVPGRDRGTVDLDRLPVSFLDLTGFAISIAVAEPAPDAGERPLADAADVPNGIRVFWLGAPAPPGFGSRSSQPAPIATASDSTKRCRSAG